MPTLAAVIREFDPNKYRSVEVAKILGCRDEYVRVAWQRMDPARKQADAEYSRNRYWAKKRRARERFKARPAEASA